MEPQSLQFPNPPHPFKYLLAQGNSTPICAVGIAAWKK